MKIYTRTGDTGTSSLADGERVLKNDLRLEAYGTTDELNAQLALLRTLLKTEEEKNRILELQKHLFRISGRLAYRKPPENDNIRSLFQDYARLDKELTHQLEKAIDCIQKKLPVTHSFVVPGGSAAAAQAHICRTVCRRAERKCIAVHQTEELNESMLTFLNRLSDYLYILSRKLCLDETDELFWDGK
ncbi:MAG: cob(I)yrinic acid a,c-diamide adenosyltransferase [Bacteroidota bacterium]|nr:cob(I)yrinic acid a,c-diamide adenosyltransferase [Bacteroidota bacterium]